MTEFKPGDRVRWNTPQGETTGTVKRKLTSDTRVGNDGQKGTRVTASADDPRYLVETDESGKQAAHKAEALTKR